MEPGEREAHRLGATRSVHVNGQQGRNGREDDAWLEGKLMRSAGMIIGVIIGACPCVRTLAQAHKDSSS